eukprot:scaffold2437_cov395-Prasinococcus_capsulatus_cf.AAC.8
MTRAVPPPLAAQGSTFSVLQSGIKSNRGVVGAKRRERTISERPIRSSCVFVCIACARCRIARGPSSPLSGCPTPTSETDLARLLFPPARRPARAPRTPDGDSPALKQWRRSPRCRSGMNVAAVAQRAARGRRSEDQSTAVPD